MSDIFSCFAEKTLLPIRLVDVVKAAHRFGGADEFRFSPTSMNPDSLQGALRKFEEDGQTVADITYSSALVDQAEVRLVCAKEVVHSLDKKEHRASSQEDVLKLVHTVIPPLYLDPVLDYLKEQSPPGYRDWIGDLLAVMVLFPKKARDHFWKKYDSDALTVEQIAQIADVPRRYIRIALTPIWPKIEERLLPA